MNTIELLRATQFVPGSLLHSRVTTPVRPLDDDAVSHAIGATTQLWLKEELFQ